MRDGQVVFNPLAVLRGTQCCCWPSGMEAGRKRGSGASGEAASSTEEEDRLTMWARNTRLKRKKLP